MNIVSVNYPKIACMSFLCFCVLSKLQTVEVDVVDEWDRPFERKVEDKSPQVPAIEHPMTPLPPDPNLQEKRIIRTRTNLYHQSKNIHKEDARIDRQHQRVIKGDLPQEEQPKEGLYHHSLIEDASVLDNELDKSPREFSPDQESSMRTRPKSMEGSNLQTSPLSE